MTIYATQAPTVDATTFTTLKGLLHRVSRARHQSQHVPLPPKQRVVLAALENAGRPLSITELGKALYGSAGTQPYVHAYALAWKGYVSRAGQTAVQITAEGRMALHASEPATPVEHLLNDLSSRERALIADGVAALEQAVNRVYPQ